MAVCLLAISRAQTAVNRTTRFAPFSHRAARLTDHVHGVSGVAIHRFGTVHFTARFCNAEHHPVRSLSSLTWVAVDDNDRPIRREATTAYAGFEFAPRPSGCVPVAFEWSMPVDAIRIDARLTAEHLAHRWRVYAVGTPLRSDGTIGARDAFTSEPFAVVP